jgi:hypothetical protein
VTNSTETSNCIPRRDTAEHGGNTAKCVEAWHYSNKATRCFLSLLSGFCLEFFVRVKSVPTVQATSQLAVTTTRALA